ncbi:MAG: hypothetical protein P8Y67_06695 [Alphaproteobacteria bacterium]
MRTLQYSYKLDKWEMLATIVLAGGFSWGFFHLSQTNTSGIIFYHFIELSPDQASIFYLMWAIMFGLGAIVGLLAILRSIKSPKHVTLTETQLIVPNSGFFGKLNAVNVSDIQRLRLVTIRRHRYLYVYHTGGKLWINENFFVYETEFDKLHQALTQLTQDHEMPQQV